MKTRQILLLLILTTSYLNAQIVNIPDPNFKTLLLIGADTNEDGEIQVSEAEAITGKIDVGTYVREFYSIGKIADMTGLEAFINITGFQCDDNLLTALDLSQNTQITYLRCDQNAITELDLSNNLELLHVDCDENQISNLNVSANTELIKLYCSVNNLTALDISGLNKLEYLFCSDNQLSGIDVSQNTLLMMFLCINNQLSELDVSNNPELIYLYCHINNLSSLDISNNLQLGGLQCQDNNLTYLNVQNGYNTNFTVFNAYNNTTLTCIFVDDITYSIENWSPNNPPHFQFDTNSHFVETQTQCDAIGVNDYLLKKIDFYPNPINDYLNIKVTDKHTKLIITNMIGEIMYTSHLKTNQTNKINISSLNSGIYILSIQTNNNQSLTHKIIKL